MDKCFFENEDGPCWGKVDYGEDDHEGNPVMVCEAHAEYSTGWLKQPEKYRRNPRK